jgi:hypothetical protein
MSTLFSCSFAFTLFVGLISFPSSANASTPTCRGLAATIVSSARVITGTNGADVIVVKGAGTHFVNAGAGNDVICGSIGNDRINAGAGNDYIAGNAGSDTISGSTGNDVIAGGKGSDKISGGVGNDTISGGAGNDTISGGAGNDVIPGGSGSDKISGDAGADTVTGEAGNDVISGGAGNDTLSGGTGTDIISGGDNNDTINGGLNNDRLDGGAGNDTISGESGSDTIQGAGGADQLSGGSGSDAITGGAGDDALSGDAGADTLNGGTGTNYCTTDGADLVTDTCETQILDSSTPNPIDPPVATVPDVVAGPVVRHCKKSDAEDLLSPCAIDISDPGATNIDAVSIVGAGSELTFIWSVNGRDAIDSSWVKIAGPSGWVTSWCGFAISGTQSYVWSQGTVFTATCRIPQDAVNAEYTAYFDAGYVTGQSAQSTSADFRVIGGSPDTSAPAVTEVALSSATVATGQTLDITFAADDETGVKGVVAWVALDGYRFANNQGRSYVDYLNFFTLLNGDDKSGSYRQQVGLNSFAPAGEYTIWISSLDKLGNKVFYQTDVKFTVTD